MADAGRPWDAWLETRSSPLLPFLRRVPVDELRQARVLSSLAGLAYSPRVDPAQLWKRHRMLLVAESCTASRPAGSSAADLASGPGTSSSDSDAEDEAVLRGIAAVGSLSLAAAPGAAIDSAEREAALAAVVLAVAASQEDDSTRTEEEGESDPSTADARRPHLRPSPAPVEWFVADDASTSTRVFSIQGSCTPASWRTNLAFDPVPFEGGAVSVHRGVYHAAQSEPSSCPLPPVPFILLSSGKGNLFFILFLFIFFPNSFALEMMLWSQACTTSCCPTCGRTSTAPQAAAA